MKQWIIKDYYPHWYYAADGHWTPYQREATRFMLKEAAQKALRETAEDRLRGMKRPRVVRLVRRTTSARKETP